MAFILSSLSWIAGTRAGRAVAAVGAFLAVVWVAYVRGQSKGADDVLSEQQDDFIQRTDIGRRAGRDAEREARDMTPSEKLDAIRKNDARWE